MISDLDSSKISKQITKISEKEVSNWLGDLCKQKKLWSPDNPDCNKIPWNLEDEAYKDVNWKNILNCHGIYIFGTKEGIIRYVGKTEGQNLHKRLRGRYVGGEKGGKSQCQIAKSIRDELITNNKIKEFKENYGKDDEVIIKNYIKKYKQNYPKVRNVRLRGSLDFAYHNIDDIWFTALAIKNPDLIAVFESLFILTAKRHNKNKNVKLELLNDKN